MTVLFSTRKLLGTFNCRNVTFVSSAIRTSKDDLIFRLDFDFGKQGTWKNRLNIEASHLSGQKVLEQIRAYQDDILAQIDMLEELERWAIEIERVGADMDPLFRIVHKDMFVFQRALLQERPMLFNGFVRKETLVLQIFGEGLADLEIRSDTYGRNGVTVFVEKLKEMRDSMRYHLMSIDTVQLVKAVKVGAE